MDCYLVLLTHSYKNYPDKINTRIIIETIIKTYPKYKVECIERMSIYLRIYLFLMI